MLDTFDEKVRFGCIMAAALVGVFLWQLYEDANQVSQWLGENNSAVWAAGLFVGAMLLLCARYADFKISMQQRAVTQV